MLLLEEGMLDLAARHLPLHSAHAAACRSRRLELPALLLLVLGRVSAGKVFMDWLHIQKTGTSFAYPVLLYSCDQRVASVYGRETNLSWRGRSRARSIRSSAVARSPH